MRFILIADQHGLYNSLCVGAVPPQGPRKAFNLNFLEGQLRLRVRTVTLGQTLVVFRRLNEDVSVVPASPAGLFPVDTTGTPFCDTASRPVGDDANEFSIIIGSDEGFSETSLLRVANIIVEASGYLTIGGGNDHILMSLLRYVDNQMAAKDLSFLNGAFERIDESKIPQVVPGLAIRQYLGDTLRRAVDEAPHHTRHPVYGVCLYGSKILLETNADFAKRCREVNGDKGELTESMKYITALLTAAYFSVPFTTPSGPLPASEQEVVDAEVSLRGIGITRHNAARERVASVVERYLAHLELQDVANGKHPESVTADSCRRAFDVLRRYRTESTRAIRQTYHLPDKLSPLRRVEFETSDDHCLLFYTFDDRGNTVCGRLQFAWTDVPSPAASNADGFGEMYPHGVATGVLYLGVDDSKGIPSVTSGGVPVMIPAAVLAEHLAFLCSDACLIFSFIAAIWLTHPPLDGYNIPGLITFLCVDRRRNQSFVCSREKIMSGCRNTEGERSIQQLYHTLHSCVSRAHGLVAEGFSEGLWGHLGMQFFFQITVQQEKVAVAAMTSDGKPLPAETRALTDESDLRTLIATPFNVISKDMMEAREFVFEMYAMFVGMMSPKEVQVAAQLLKTSLLRGS